MLPDQVLHLWHRQWLLWHHPTWLWNAHPARTQLGKLPVSTFSCWHDGKQTFQLQFRRTHCWCSQGRTVLNWGTSTFLSSLPCSAAHSFEVFTWQELPEWSESWRHTNLSNFWKEAQIVEWWGATVSGVALVWRVYLWHLGSWWWDHWKLASIWQRHIPEQNIK